MILTAWNGVTIESPHEMRHFHIAMVCNILLQTHIFVQHTVTSHVCVCYGLFPKQWPSMALLMYVYARWIADYWESLSNSWNESYSTPLFGHTSIPLPLEKQWQEWKQHHGYTLMRWRSHWSELYGSGPMYHHIQEHNGLQWALPDGNQWVCRYGQSLIS